MKKTLFLLVALVMMASLFTGCAQQPAPVSPAAPASPDAPSGGSGGQGEQSPEQSSEPIKIGYVGALSGETALWGQAGLNGMLMTAEKVNAAGGVLGRQIEVIGLDGRGDPQDSLNAFLKLIDEHKVVAVVGTNFSSCNIPMAPVATQKQVPLIGTAPTNELVTVDENGNLHPFSFRLTFIDNFQGAKMGEYAIREGFRNGAILTDVSDPYSTGISRYCIESFTANGGTMVAQEEANHGDNDFRAPLTKIKAANPDVLFIPWIYGDVALIAKQARELGIDCMFYGFDGWDSLELPQLAAGTLEGTRFCSRPGFALPDARAYGEEYQAKFNIELETECLFGNDAILWLVQVINEAGSADSIAIRDGLASTTNFEGLLGKMSIDPATHNPQRELGIFEIRGNEYVLVELFG